MKRRHLQADGYKVVNIPYTTYSTSYTDTNKKIILRKYLAKLSR